MTLPAHRRVSKESQSNSGSFSTPGKLAGRTVSDLASTSSKEFSTSKGLSERKSDTVASTPGYKEREALNIAPFKDVKQSRLALPLDLPRGLAASAIGSAKIIAVEKSPPGKQVSAILQAPVASPFQSNLPPINQVNHSQAPSPFATAPVDPARKATPEATENSQRQDTSEGNSPVQPSSSPMQEANQITSLTQDQAGTTTAKPVQKSQALSNPFASVSSQFVRAEGNTSEPFGAQRIL